MKTGTAEAVIDDTVGLVSIAAGIISVGTPCLTITVVLYNPKVVPTPSDSPTPLFGDIVRTTVANLGIPASTGSTDLCPITL